MPLNAWGYDKLTPTEWDGDCCILIESLEVGVGLPTGEVGARWADEYPSMFISPKNK